MKNGNNYLPVIINRGVFNRIREFIFKLFGKHNEETIAKYNEEDVFHKKDVSFKEDIKMVDEYQEEKSIKAKLDKNEIKILDLSSNQKQKMIEFYKKEIKQKEEKLNNIKQKILRLKHV